jgi:condensation domain-containing protein
MTQKRKLSTIEHVLDGNIVYVVRLEGRLSIDQLRSALSLVQRKHPALRALIRQERDGLYYEADCAPEIPLRSVQRKAEDDYRRECKSELMADFAYDQPQLRAVWLQAEGESDLLLTTSHRICDGMSVVIIVREVLRSLYSDEELTPYEPITTQDIIGDYRPPQPWKRKLKAFVLNSLLRMVPPSHRAPDNNEQYLEWKVDRVLSDALKQRCKAEGISIHAALVVALERALFAVFGKDLPKWIGNQIDPRRGRFAALKSDMLFFGGGSFKVYTGQAPELAFWARARAIHQEMPGLIEEEILKIPSRFHFIEMLRPPSNGQIQSIMQLENAFKKSGKLTGFALSNLGNISLSDSDAPFHVKDLRLYVHSFKTRAVGLVAYSLNGEMRFNCMADEKSMSLRQMGSNASSWPCFRTYACRQKIVQKSFLSYLLRQLDNFNHISRPIHS